MKRFLNILTSAFSVLAVLLLSGACGEEKEKMEEPYLNVENTYVEAEGEGDGVLLSIRSNLSWTITVEDASGAEAEWVAFDYTSGEGDADVLGFVQQGSRTEDRSCNFVVRSTDRSKEVSIPFKQSKFSPTLRQVAFTSLTNMAANLEEGVTEPLMDFSWIEATVVGVPGENIPAGYSFITDDGTLFVKMRSSSASLKEGDRIQVEFTEGTILRENNGGILIDITMPVTVLSSGQEVKPARITADAVSRYENALVQVDPCLVQDSYLGKTWKGTVGMDAGKHAGGLFDVEVAEGASFSGTSVPSGACSVTGIVIGGKVHPRSAADIVAGASGRDILDDPYTIDPIRCFFQVDPATNKYVNGKASDATRFTFSAAPDFSIDGAVIEKVGGTDNNLNLVVANGQPLQTCFTTRNWNTAGNYLLYTIPVNQKIYGDLEFGFSVSCGAANVFSGPWKVFWSTDQATWHKVDAVYGGSNQTAGSGGGGEFSMKSTAHGANRYLAEFSIPESNAVSSGFLYFKLEPPEVSASNSTRTLRCNVGFVLSSRLRNYPMKAYHNVILNEAFEEAVNGISPVQGFPIYYFGYNSNSSAYTGRWQITGNSSQARGSLRMSSNSGENYLTSPALSALTTTTDLIVTFKAAPYASATSTALLIHSNQLGVRCIGGGTAGEIMWDNPDFGSDPFHWHTATCMITGAGPSTQIQIGNLSASTATGAFYIDDIVVSR